MVKRRFYSEGFIAQGPSYNWEANKLKEMIIQNV